MVKNSNRLVVLLFIPVGCSVNLFTPFSWWNVEALGQASEDIIINAADSPIAPESAEERSSDLLRTILFLTNKKHKLEVQLELERAQVRALAEAADAERKGWESSLIASEETLDQTKMALDEVMKDYEYKKAKLDGDKLLLKSALKSPLEVAHSEAAERTALQSVEKVQREEIEHTKTLQAKKESYEEVKARAPRRSDDVNKRVNDILKQIDSINQDIELLKTKGASGLNIAVKELQPTLPPVEYQPLREPFIFQNPTESTRPIPAITAIPSSGGQAVVWTPVPSNRSSIGNNEYDRRAMELAQQLRSTSAEKRDQKKVEALREVLNESFASKQEIHEQRLETLSEEVAKTKETLQKRKANQAEIVELRMNELLDNRDVKSWEYDPRKLNSVAPVVVPLDSQWSVPLNKAPDGIKFLRLKPQAPDLSMLGSLLLRSLKDLKEGKKGNNRSAIESMTSRTRYFESSWSNRKQELQVSEAELTKQIDELNKLIESDRDVTDESMQKVVEYQIQSLTEKREQVLISAKWMKDFEANQLAEFQKLRELVALEKVVKPQEKPAEKLNPTDSK